MEIIRNLYNIRPDHRGCVVTIGNFDGVHLGHGALLKKLVTVSKQLHLPSLAIIFEPQPSEFFTKKKYAARLMRFREKIAALARQGIDRVLCLRFNEKIANQTAEEFIHKILVEKLAVKYVLVGDDFKFGYKRLGDFSLLQLLGEQYFFQAECMNTFEVLGTRVSSTRIRQLLEEGNLVQAQALLGRPFSLQGRIAHGDKRGRFLGFPTANIHLYRKWVPVSGIFAVEMIGIDSLPMPGVANVGTRPTIQGETRTLLEVYLLNFNQDIYGRQVEVRFLHKFRDEMKFDDLEQLKAQIAKDVEAARLFFC